MRKISGLYFWLIMLISLLSLTPEVSEAGWYYGAGPGIAVPQGEVGDTTDLALGAHLIFESRHYCPLWFGLRIDWYNFDKVDDVQSFLAPYYKQALYLSPTVRYNFFTDNNCYDIGWRPYLQSMLIMSSMDNNDARSRLGLGGAIGIGFAGSFQLLDLCWNIDAYGHYSAPNFIIAADGRPKLTSLNAGLTLSVSP